MGFYDEIGDDDDEAQPAPHDGDVDVRANRSGLALLSAERAVGSAQLIRWGALGARLGALGPAEREACALLNLSRIIRRSLAAAAIEPSEALGPLLGHDDDYCTRPELAAARFLLGTVLTPIAKLAGGADALVATRLLHRLQRQSGGRNDDLIAEDKRAIDDVAASIGDVAAWLTARMQTADPMFTLTDVVAAHGAELHGFPLGHLPDNDGAHHRAMVLESYRGPAAALPAALDRLRLAAPEDGLLTGFDLAAGLALARRLPPAPLLTGLIRRELFRRDLHYPADLGSLFAALQVGLANAERDLANIETWRRAGASGRVQLVALATLSAFGSLTTGALARLAGTTWQGMQASLRRLGPARVRRQWDGRWHFEEAAPQYGQFFGLGPENRACQEARRARSMGSRVS